MKISKKFFLLTFCNSLITNNGLSSDIVKKSVQINTNLNSRFVNEKNIQNNPNIKQVFSNELKSFKFTKEIPSSGIKDQWFIIINYMEMSMILIYNILVDIIVINLLYFLIKKINKKFFFSIILSIVSIIAKLFTYLLLNQNTLTYNYFKKNFFKNQLLINLFPGLFIVGFLIIADFLLNKNNNNNFSLKDYYYLSLIFSIFGILISFLSLSLLKNFIIIHVSKLNNIKQWSFDEENLNNLNEYIIKNPQFDFNNLFINSQIQERLMNRNGYWNDSKYNKELYYDN